MPMTEQQRKDAKALLGPASETFSDDQFAGALLVYAQSATGINENLSTANETLQEEYDAFRDQHPEIIELSAATKAIAAENARLKIGVLAGKHKWPESFAKKLEEAFVAPDVIMLSAAAAPESPALPMKLLALLDELPARPRLDASGREITGPQDPKLIALSRSETDVLDPASVEPPVATAGDAGAYGDTIKAWGAKPLDKTA